jgi:RNA polymerase sigma-70 factor (ECF subfamily)
MTANRPPDHPPPPAAPAGGPSPSSTSLSLLQRVRDRDQDAWRRLVQLYRPLVCHWCGRQGVTAAAADDLVQEVFLAAFTRLDHFRRDRPGDTFRGWLRGITRRVLLAHFRRRAGQPAAAGGTDAFLRLQDVAEAAPASDEADSPAEVRALYHRALELVRGEFEGRTWQMFWRSAVEGHAPADIAAEFQVTPNAVRKAKSRVLHRLREELGDLIDDV